MLFQIQLTFGSPASVAGAVCATEQSVTDAIVGCKRLLGCHPYRELKPVPKHKKQTPPWTWLYDGMLPLPPHLGQLCHPNIELGCINRFKCWIWWILKIWTNPSLKISSAVLGLGLMRTLIFREPFVLVFWLFTKSTYLDFKIEAYSSFEEAFSLAVLWISLCFSIESTTKFSGLLSSLFPLMWCTSKPFAMGLPCCCSTTTRCSNFQLFSLVSNTCL